MTFARWLRPSLRSISLANSVHRPGHFHPRTPAQHVEFRFAQDAANCGLRQLRGHIQVIGHFEQARRGSRRGEDDGVPSVTLSRSHISGLAWPHATDIGHAVDRREESTRPFGLPGSPGNTTPCSYSRVDRSQKVETRINSATIQGPIMPIPPCRSTSRSRQSGYRTNGANPDRA